jgi:hypothetical protein
LTQKHPFPIPLTHIELYTLSNPTLSLSSSLSDVGTPKSALSWHRVPHDTSTVHSINKTPRYAHRTLPFPPDASRTQADLDISSDTTVGLTLLHRCAACAVFKVDLQCIAPVLSATTRSALILCTKAQRLQCLLCQSRLVLDHVRFGSLYVYASILRPRFLPQLDHQTAPCCNTMGYSYTSLGWYNAMVLWTALDRP